MIWIGIDLLKGVNQRRLCLLKNHLKLFLEVYNSDTFTKVYSIMKRTSYYETV